IAIVAADAADDILAAMRAHPLGRDSAIVGTVTERHPGMVTMKTAFGTSRIVDLLPGDQLPRIC
ncbi:MAG: hydrogenase expression/formation protein HypE, partial [Candidatus Solibacter sp.]